MRGGGTPVPSYGTTTRGASAAAPDGRDVRAAPSAEKVLHVLAAFERRARWGLVDLARDLGIPKSTAHRLLASLCAVGFVQHDPHEGDYLLGPRAWGLAGRAGDADTLADLAMPTLRDLRTATGETTFLTVQEGAQARCAARVNAEHEVAVLIAQGAASPLHLGASNTVLLAFLPETERRLWVAETLEDAEARAAVETELRAIEAAGFAYSASQLTPGAAAIGVPVRGASGRVLAGLSIGAPVYRFSRDRALEMLPLLARAGDALSRRFGYVGSSAARR